jgi:hypothetical protein
MATQREQRTRIEIDTVMDWYKAGHFKTDEEARGAFELAYQQGMDGMGTSPAEWMGMTNDEYDAWMRSSALPKR